jgi:exodeoxyribonuclease-3
MPEFKIATWNVNSLRVRLPHVLAWLQENQPDVLALQELKLHDDDFPHDALKEAGYSAVVSGQKTYNGVALLSRREPMVEVVKAFPELEDPQRRVLAVTYHDIRILNLYVPNGESLVSQKYLYKLHWLEQLDLFLKHELKKYPKMIVLGDFNIAPDNIDVYDPTRWENSVLFSKPERDAFKAMLEVGFVDCYRALTPAAQEYSWWDYRMGSFRRNHGLRIDHILASTAFFPLCQACRIDKTPRALERPSDHAPVVATFVVD